MRTKIIWILVISLAVMGLGLGWAGWSAYRVYQYFDQRLAVSPEELVVSAVEAMKSEKLNGRDWYYVLVLGLDPRDDALERTMTTDTIMVAGINMNTAEIRLISIPRDLWLIEEKYKVNKLYMEMGDGGLWWVRQKISKLVGIEIDRAVVVKTNNLIDLVGMVGGVEVELPEKLVDYEYPNPEYVKNPRSGASVYMKIEYPSGKQIIDETNVEPFVRSRKSNGEGGTDLGRIRRQQILVEAMMSKLVKERGLLTVDKIIEIVNYWETEIDKDVNWGDIFDVGWRMRDGVSEVKLTTLTVPVGGNKGEGVIYYPGYVVQGQWVFLPSGGDYGRLREFFDLNMGEL